jgi:hypothetical protein
MKAHFWLLLAALTLPAALLGCKDGASSTAGGPNAAGGPTDRVDPADAPANLAKLSPEDRKLAEEQRFCAVRTEDPLGSMGVPVKVMVKDQPVFLCCAACRTKAVAHADRTLAKVKELKEKNTGTTVK